MWWAYLIKVDDSVSQGLFGEGGVPRAGAGVGRWQGAGRVQWLHIVEGGTLHRATLGSFTSSGLTHTLQGLQTEGGTRMKTVTEVLNLALWLQKCNWSALAVEWYIFFSKPCAIKCHLGQTNGISMWLWTHFTNNLRALSKFYENACYPYFHVVDPIRSSDNDSTGLWPPGSLHTLGADGHI